MPSCPARLKLDGPSLVLEVKGCAPRRFPLGRISHLLVGGRIQLEAGALAACLERRIGMTFVGENALLAGYALPAVDRPWRSQERLEEFLSRPDWRERYTDWKRAWRRREMRTACSEAGVDASRPDWSETGWKGHWVRLFAGWGIGSRELEDWVGFDHALLASRAVRFLSQQGVEPTVLTAGPVLPAADWTYLLGPRCYPDLFWLVRRSRGLLPQLRKDWKRRLTEFAEVRSRRDDRRMGDVWGSFLAMVSWGARQWRMNANLGMGR